MAAPASASGGSTESTYGRQGERAVEGIRDMIASGTLQPGQHLRQDDIAARIGMTRVPVREAFQRLAAEGLLEHRRNQGYFVSKLRSTQLHQICWLRDTIENRLATTLEWPDQERIDELHRLNDQLTVHESPDGRDLIVADRNFHRSLWQLSTESVLVEEISRMWQQLEPYRIFMSFEPPVPKRLHGDHASILTALKQRDRAAYLRALHNHQQRTYPTIARLAEREAREESGGR